MKDSPGIHLNMAGKTISIQKQLLLLYEERSNEQKKWIELLARKVNALEKAYGAQFIWKIDHYSERLQEARTNKKTAIFSPPFLTSRHGYCLALSICLCGDGKGKRKFNQIIGFKSFSFCSFSERKTCFIIYLYMSR